MYPSKHFTNSGDDEVSLIQGLADIGSSRDQRYPSDLLGYSSYGGTIVGAHPKIKLGRALINAVTGTYPMSVVPQGQDERNIAEARARIEAGKIGRSYSLEIRWFLTSLQS